MKPQIDNSKFHLENNPESFERYKNDLSHYNNQCRIVIEQMLTGCKLTTMTAMSLGIGDLRRRCKDLRDLHNIPVISRYLEGTRYKEYYLSKDFIEKF